MSNTRMGVLADELRREMFLILSTLWLNRRAVDGEGKALILDVDEPMAQRIEAVLGIPQETKP
jgi:hypothetical protein